jgi:ribonucleotide reductase alpha subunit
MDLIKTIANIQRSQDYGLDLARISVETRILDRMMNRLSTGDYEDVKTPHQAGQVFSEIVNLAEKVYMEAKEIQKDHNSKCFANAEDLTRVATA